MISFTSILSNGIFDRCPNVRFAFLEAGVAWLFLLLERLTGSNRSFSQPNPRHELLRLGDGELASDYIQRQIAAGRILIGCEGDEPELAHAVKVAGNRPFLFSSDFPHEVTNETCKGEVRELLGNPRLTQADKEAILHGNAERFYRLGPAAR